MKIATYVFEIYSDNGHYLGLVHVKKLGDSGTPEPDEISRQAKYRYPTAGSYCLLCITDYAPTPLKGFIK